MNNKDENNRWKESIRGKNKIFYGEFRTNKWRVLAGGSKIGQSKLLRAPEGYYIAGFFGRAGTNIDKLGIICIPVK